MPEHAEIRWNTFDGPVLGHVTGPQFSQPVTIPAVAPGLYTILVLERIADGTIGSTARTAFQVVGAAAPVQPPRPAAALAASSRPSSRSATPSVLLGMVLGAGLVAVGYLARAAAGRRARSGVDHGASG
ncbi:MAG TPA: hypothetical protein VFJ85_06385 [Acidimicrobiales bacterium]|nr:hypothetical protein [Acidimicrobiales bacterium]